MTRAVEILRHGGLVAFPTETVYGLGADATNRDAVRRIFAAKGRPSVNPLICHVADEQTARRYAANWSSTASKLAQHFWPGPLTLVVPKTDAIVPEVTAGLETVGLRAPDHPLTLELLREFDGAIAGPSANQSSHISPTTAQHVRDELGDAVDLILDGGPCEVGIESTVLDLSGTQPSILRPGAITQEQIEAIIGPVQVKTLFTEVRRPLVAPGQLSVHYAPRSPAFRFETSQRDRVPSSAVVLELQDDTSEYARTFYARLRELDSCNPSAIYIEMPPYRPEWFAVRDRIFRASKPFAG
jgi:L-threonylcarbamoyladenylate synthase